MAKVAIMMADGTEEIEALTVVDILRRAGITIDVISIMGRDYVTTSHNIKVTCDMTFEQADKESYDALVIPGGMPGTNHLMAHSGVCEWAKDFASSGKLISAICAAPSVLGTLGLLDGYKATCFPGFEDKLTGATHISAPAVVDRNRITGKGMGAAIDFSLAILAYLKDQATADDISSKIQYK